ncbi:MAG: type II secretion system secretin GspD [Kiritimatiellia bacterium]
MHRYGSISVALAVTLSIVCLPVPGQVRLTDPTGTDTVTPRLKFEDTPVEIVLEQYSELTGRTLLLDPKIPRAKITLRNQTELTVSEALEAMETVLTMHGIALIKEGKKFLKVVPVKEGLQEGTEIRQAGAPREKIKSSELISEMIALNHIDIKEAEKAIKNIKHSYGQLQLFERTNSILVTDTAGNIERLMQIISFIDQPIRKLEEPNIIEIRYARAADIKKKLEEILKETMEEEAARSTVPRQRKSGAPGAEKARTPPGVIRAPREKTAEAEIPAEIIELAERGIITGEVKIIADDRTNILIIITRPENMTFFEKIVKVLDVPTDPDVVVKVVRLEFASAETVAGTLNTLIGKKDKKGEVPPPKAGGEEEGRSAALREYVEQLRSGAAELEEGKSKVGELLAENIKILPDKRTNSLLIMASKADMAALEEIIASMDMMLSQVLIEVAIIQVDLGNQIESGVHWVQRSLTAYDKREDGTSSAKFAGAGSMGGGADTLEDAATLTTLGSWARGSGLTAYFTHFGLSMDLILHWVQTDDRTHVLSTPVIVTTDNTKAIISSSEQRYFLKGSTIDQYGNVRPQTEIKDFGLELEVTPHINEAGNVMMEISQDISDVGTSQEIELEKGFKAEWPTTKKRSFTASISVHDRETIVLGGLVRSDKSSARKKVPLLGSIPLLGKLFRYEKEDENRAEVVVFVTPYVLNTPKAIALESARRKESLNVGGLWKRGWSDSKLAEPMEEDLRQALEESKQEGEDAEEPDADSPKTRETKGKDGENDVELQEFISEQENKWAEPMREMDRLIERELDTE